MFKSMQQHLPELNVLLANGSASVASELSQLSGARVSEPFEKEPRGEKDAPEATDDHMHDVHDHDNVAEIEEQDKFDQSRKSLGNPKLVSLPDLLPFDRKLFGHPYRNCQTVSDIIKTVASEHACCAYNRDSSISNATKCMPNMHEGEVWRWAHLSPKSVNVAVVTPGRLVHHLQELGSNWLANLELLVRTTQYVVFTLRSTVR